MSKKFLFKFTLILALLAVAVLWLLKAVLKDNDMFAFFNLSWTVIIVSAVWGLAFVCAGLFSKTVGMAKKLYIFLGAALFIIGIITLIGEFAIDNNTILPIVAVVMCGALILALFATGAKKWDQGDNKNVGYKDYHARKAEKKNKSED